MVPKPKFYAVKKGHTPGIYTSWDECNKQVKGYAGNEFKSFNYRQEAEQFMGGIPTSTLGPAMPHVPAMSQSSSKRPKTPVLLQVKRSRSISPGLARPSVKAEAVDTAAVPQEQADDVYQIEYDGASKSNPGPAGAGALVRRPDGSMLCELREGLGTATNNVAEYRAFILGLKGALDRGIYRVRVQGDSKLLTEQVLGRWKVNDNTLAILCKEAHMLIQNFNEFSLRHIDRQFNAPADQLANEAVFLQERKFVSAFGDIEVKTEDGAVLGDPNSRQVRGNERVKTEVKTEKGATFGDPNW